jgi:hypothetical protein
MTRSDKNLLAEISADFESSDTISRWDGLTDYAEAEYMSDDELYNLLADDYESSDGNSRYDYIDEIEPVTMDGTAEDIPVNTCDFIAEIGNDCYYFQAKTTVEEEKYDMMQYNHETDTYH